MQAGSGLIIQHHLFFFIPRLSFYTTVTCNVDSYALIIPTHTRKWHPHTDNVTQPTKQWRYSTPEFSFPLFYSFYFIWQIILHFFFFQFLQSFFFSLFLFSFIYNSKNKSFSSRFYIRHLQVQCVTCPSYKVHLYFLIMSRLCCRTNPRGAKIKGNTVRNHRNPGRMIQEHHISSLTSQYCYPITRSVLLLIGTDSIDA